MNTPPPQGLGGWHLQGPLQQCQLRHLPPKVSTCLANVWSWPYLVIYDYQARADLEQQRGQEHQGLGHDQAHLPSHIQVRPCAKLGKSNPWLFWPFLTSSGGRMTGSGWSPVIPRLISLLLAMMLAWSSLRLVLINFPRDGFIIVYLFF